MLPDVINQPGAVTCLKSSTERIELPWTDVFTIDCQHVFPYWTVTKKRTNSTFIKLTYSLNLVKTHDQSHFPRLFSVFILKKLSCVKRKYKTLKMNGIWIDGNDVALISLLLTLSKYRTLKLCFHLFPLPADSCPISL